jgi:hypothetical protein
MYNIYIHMNTPNNANTTMANINNQLSQLGTYFKNSLVNLQQQPMNSADINKLQGKIELLDKLQKLLMNEANEIQNKLAQINQMPATNNNPTMLQQQQQLANTAMSPQLNSPLPGMVGGRQKYYGLEDYINNII